jgi:aminoglycoside phosphotransferase family enzyme/predicted kinase
MAASHPPLVTALLNPGAYGHDAADVRLVETHISWVFLTGRYAYKVKKPIKLPFLDFSSLEQRRHFCEQELALNRRLAPQLYLEVVPIGGRPEAARIGATPAIDYAVKMRQFPDDARLDRQLAAGTLPDAALLDFAAKLAAFHASEPALRGQRPEDVARATAAAAEENVRELLDETRDHGDVHERVAKLADWTRRRAQELLPHFAARYESGAHKDCHGDLHLENLLIEGGAVVAFDALEFDPALRQIDVLRETSFLAMDLAAHGRSDLAFRFLTRYLEAGGDYDGLEVLPFYAAYQALVRAKVRAMKAAQTGEAFAPEQFLPYVEIAEACARERRPLLLITHGYSGSGKTTITEQLLGRVPALRVRSDLERKRLHGLAAAERSGSAVGGGLYTSAASTATYERLAQIADRALRSRIDLIVDAAFLHTAEREPFRALAERRDARFAILDCAAPEMDLRERIAARAAQGRDASEATSAVLDHQLAHSDPLTAAERAAAVTVRTGEPVDAAALAERLRAFAVSL